MAADHRPVAIVHPGWITDTLGHRFLSFGQLVGIHQLDPRRVRIINAGNKHLDPEELASLELDHEVTHYYPEGTR